MQPDSQLIVARTATRQNKSFYSINGKSSSYTEVTQLLRDRGVDLDHKRFLILQVFDCFLMNGCSSKYSIYSFHALHLSLLTQSHHLYL